MEAFLLAAVAIVAIIGAVVVFAIRYLKSPRRVAVVIGSIAALVIALATLFETLRPAEVPQAPSAPPHSPVAPVHTPAPQGSA